MFFRFNLNPSKLNKISQKTIDNINKNQKFLIQEILYILEERLESHCRTYPNCTKNVYNTDFEDLANCLIVDSGYDSSNINYSKLVQMIADSMNEVYQTLHQKGFTCNTYDISDDIQESSIVIQW